MHFRLLHDSLPFTLLSFPLCLVLSYSVHASVTVTLAGALLRLLKISLPLYTVAALLFLTFSPLGQAQVKDAEE